LLLFFIVEKRKTGEMLAAKVVSSKTSLSISTHTFSVSIRALQLQVNFYLQAILIIKNSF
jgi:hypothetical protein